MAYSIGPSCGCGYKTKEEFETAVLRMWLAKQKREQTNLPKGDSDCLITVT